MRTFVVSFLVFASTLALDARAGDCAPAAFGSVKVEVDERASPLTPPKQFVLPERWIAVNSAGFFINEGQDDWLILDIDTRSLLHVAFVAKEKYHPGRYTGYTAIAHEPGWIELRRTVTVPADAFDSIMCKANFIWAYESPYAASNRKYDEQITENTREEKAALKGIREWKAWEKSSKLCRRTKECHPVPPPLLQPISPPPLPPFTDEGNELFQHATDVGETLILNDHKVRKTIGGSGVLAGEADALRNQLFELMKAPAE